MQFRQPQQVVSLNNRISPVRCDLAPSFDQSMAPPIMAESFNGSPHYGSIFESIKSHVLRSAASPPNGSESNCQVTTRHLLDMGSRKLLNQCLMQHVSSLINCGIAMSFIGLMQIVVVNCPTEEWISSDQKKHLNVFSDGCMIRPKILLSDEFGSEKIVWTPDECHDNGHWVSSSKGTRISQEF